MCPTISNDMRRAMLDAWNAIGHDYFQVLAEGEDEVVCKQRDVIEMVLDCDRLEQYGKHTPEFAAFRSFTYEEKVAIAKLAFPDIDYCA
jgi:hypothetical protein